MGTPSTVQRAAEVGDTFRTITNAGVHSQAVAIVEENGAQCGITGTPLVTSVSNTVTVSGTVGVSGTVPVSGTVTANPTAETFVRYSSPAAEDSEANIGTGPCELRQLRVLLAPAATTTRYLMFFNSLTLPANGTAPVWRMLAPGAGEASETFVKGEMAFATGLTVALSSTISTLTVTTASEAYFEIVVAT